MSEVDLEQRYSGMFEIEIIKKKKKLKKKINSLMMIVICWTLQSN